MPQYHSHISGRDAHSIDATKIVGKAQFSAKVAAAFENVKCAETPAEDAKTRATLLGISSDKLGDTAVGFPKGGETFASYGRAFTFLDIAETELRAHNKEFLVDTITAKHGHVLNTGAQSFNCHGYGTKSFGGGEYLEVDLKAKIGLARSAEPKVTAVALAWGMG
ncbi:hypothetical protein DFH08DRAFT_825185 [Mycena albidolilacea]|uniref:Uncharacterized protein n=1 Tax=Mycena albidolilacea TaxID=1033008 RepID=A0AAD6Z2V0_9AGAR|nr:hypothetical protein DFH08DRAFT_825185 [Mycena albidolilacea]